MTLQILIHGRPLTPEEALQRQRPLDTMLVCPNCEGTAVEAFRPKTGHRWPEELRLVVPRQQDRHCLYCGHRWMAVLPPALLTPLP